ncbi:MAG: CO dehydrogenase/acetyl-CoA synthase subunit delta [Methanocalculus sp.]|uniref:CO dehydrogenase/acetyl-CoA synthase subunit delta n=1 Tax=Methanocalculus sp. TaxID=2004547 RepID=UPI00271B7126|nr:CO dehydrogenase/acetyl-CoA synthase subunit delta [Methanocalculus sp.]MDO9540485.1 CO dehydrogenase/acetyl-CoA synthase subunit delta [Methanocalculus sp.]
MCDHNNNGKGNEAFQESIPRLLSLLSGVEKMEFENFSMEIGDLELWIPMMGTSIAPSQSSTVFSGSPAAARVKPTSLLSETFVPPQEEFPGSIREVRLGATKSEGGSRGRSLVIGGANSRPFVYADKPPVHPPVFALDVFDTDLHLPMALKANIKDVMSDPAEWARMNVKKFGADMVTVHLMSTDPLISDRSPADAARTVEEVLQAVDVPLIIGGCGDPHKDAEVFKKVAEIAAGERVLFNSLTLDMANAKTLEGVALAAKEHGHAVLGFTGLDLNKAKEMNRRLYEYLPPEDIVMDLTTVALGYGLEYSFTIHERARHAALMGDTELQHPTISAATNAWAAREAWMKMDPKYGSRELRGPLWETINGITLLLAGVDIFMMMHPAAIRTLKETVNMLMQRDMAVTTDHFANWATTKI